MRTALVTGGNRGIGLGIVKGLAEQGFHVLLASRNLERATDVAAQFDEKVTAVELNLSNPSVLRQQIAHIQNSHPSIDVLVNNAGVLFDGDLLSVSSDHLYETMQVNVMSAIELIRAIAPGMNQRGYGRIVNLSSGWGAFSDGLDDGPASYSMSKAALNAVTVVTKPSLGDNVKINSMCPGWVRTDMGGAGATRSVEQGADTAIWLATLPENAPSGGFFRDRKPIKW